MNFRAKARMTSIDGMFFVSGFLDQFSEFYCNSPRSCSRNMASVGPIQANGMLQQNAIIRAGCSNPKYVVNDKAAKVAAVRCGGI